MQLPKLRGFTLKSVSFIKNFKLADVNVNPLRGFTLIELLIVISIIAILVAAATASWTQAQVKARDGKRKADVKSIQTALELYYSENQTYPESNRDGQIMCGITAFLWGDRFICDSKTYMSQLPADPKGTTDYFYKSLKTTDASGKKVYLQYQIGADLENTRDPEHCTASDCDQIDPVTGAPPKLPCVPNGGTLGGGGLSYCAIQP